MGDKKSLVVYAPNPRTILPAVLILHRDFHCFDSYFVYSSGQSEDGAVLAFKVDLTVYVKQKRRWFAGNFEAAAIDSHFNIYNRYGDQILVFKGGRFFVKDIFDGTLTEALIPVPELEKLKKEMERSFYFADSMGIHQV